MTARAGAKCVWMVGKALYYERLQKFDNRMYRVYHRELKERGNDY